MSGIATVEQTASSAQPMPHRVACAWCSAEMSPGREPTSHSICETCGAREFPEDA